MSILNAFQIYLLAINVVTFAAFVVDKLKAMRGAWRISEATLLGLSLAGGSVGGILGMLLARHKIRKRRFRYGLPAMLVAQVVGVALLVHAGAL